MASTLNGTVPNGLAPSLTPKASSSSAPLHDPSSSRSIPAQAPSQVPLGRAYDVSLRGDPQGEGPEGIGAYFLPPQDGLGSQSWEEIREICATGDLDHLNRHKACEERYFAWSKSTRARWNGLERYLRFVRLGWGDDVEAMFDMEQGASRPPYFVDTDNESLVKRIPNDWPYAIPPACEHWVVWSKVPIYHSDLFTTPDTPFAPGPAREALYDAIASDGVRGMTGVEDPSSAPRVFGLNTRRHLLESEAIQTLPSDITEVLVDEEDEAEYEEPLAAPAPRRPSQLSLPPPPPFYGHPGAPASQPPTPGRLGRGEPEDVNLLAERAQAWAGRFIAQYVKRVWDEDEWETSWFCNPPHLRTVPGLSHFHVIARRKESRVPVQA